MASDFTPKGCGGAALIMALYPLVNTAYFDVLAPHEIACIAPDSSVAREVVERFLGKAAAGVLAAGMMLSAYGTLHIGFLGMPRIPTHSHATPCAQSTASCSRLRQAEKMR
jgi:hypothetical protein